MFLAFSPGGTTATIPFVFVSPVFGLITTEAESTEVDALPLCTQVSYALSSFTPLSFLDLRHLWPIAPSSHLGPLHCHFCLTPIVVMHNALVC